MSKEEETGIISLHEMKYEDLTQSQKDRLAEVRKMGENEFTTYTIESFKVETVEN